MQPRARRIDAGDLHGEFVFDSHVAGKMKSAGFESDHITSPPFDDGCLLDLKEVSRFPVLQKNQKTPDRGFGLLIGIESLF